MRPLIVLLGALSLVMALPAVVFANDPPPALGPGFYDDGAPVVLYSGAWVLTPDETAYGGSYTASSTQGDSVTISIWGDGFAVYGAHGPDGGADHLICVLSGGDELCTSYSQYSPAPAPQARTEITALGAGVHTITITSGGGVLSLDAVHVLPPVQPDDPEPAPQHAPWVVLSEPEDEQAQVYAVDYSLRPSDVAIVAILAGILMSNLLTFAYTLWKAR